MQTTFLQKSNMLWLVATQRAQCCALVPFVTPLSSFLHEHDRDRSLEGLSSFGAERRIRLGWMNTRSPEADLHSETSNEMSRAILETSSYANFAREYRKPSISTRYCGEKCLRRGAQFYFDKIGSFKKFLNGIPDSGRFQRTNLSFCLQ